MRRGGTVGIDLTRTTFWFSDERCVAARERALELPDGEQALLGPARRRQPPAVLRMEGELGPMAGAASYEAGVRERRGRPALDLLLLGLGTGRPHRLAVSRQADVEERSRLAVGVADAGLEPFVPRITLTLPALIAPPERSCSSRPAPTRRTRWRRAFGPHATPDPHVPASMRAAAGERALGAAGPRRGGAAG